MRPNRRSVGPVPGEAIARRLFLCVVAVVTVWACLGCNAGTTGDGPAQKVDKSKSK